MKCVHPKDWRTASWVTIYFSQIIAFAFIYFLQSPSFYHATSHLEPSIWNDQRKMALEYQEQLENNRADLRLAEDFGELPVSVLFRFDREENKAKVTIQDGGLGFRGFTGDVYLASQGDRLIVGTSFFDERELDEKYGQNTRPPWSALSFEPSEEFVTLFRGWRAANNGKITRWTDMWPRLLYFSVITTTTLGYGDIVPLTSWARFWVAVQSIFGVVLVGGFLHSLLSRRYQTRCVNPDHDSTAIGG